MKPGTKVKVTNPERGFEWLKGRRGYIKAIGRFVPGNYELLVVLDYDDEWFFFRWELAPDTDEKAEAFLASIKKLTPLQEEELVVVDFYPDPP